ncbi:hypothetical protein [Microbacterium sp.]|uniref:hypothetical protein n=1 Tax=Microbacterium sp. TaxID=51671 RepID=UPI0039E3DC79
MSRDATRSGGPGWLRTTLTAIAGLFYAYAIWNAVAHLAALATPDGLSGLGWMVLGFGIVFPALVFGFALVVGRRRPVEESALVLLAGLALVAVFWLSMLGYSILNMSDLVGAGG